MGTYGFFGTTFVDEVVVAKCGCLERVIKGRGLPFYLVNIYYKLRELLLICLEWGEWDNGVKGERGRK